MDLTILLSTAYLPPVRYFTKFLIPGKVVIEAHENYTKQTYRNRCSICTANGRSFLIVPVVRGSFHKVHIKDLRIDNSTPWQTNHERAIISSYNRSPFFEYYGSEILAAIRRKEKFLLDFNCSLTNLLLGILNIKQGFELTTSYSATGTEGILDYRDSIHPKKSTGDPHFIAMPYIQVFNDRYGFIPGQSIIDLLFNMGPDSTAYMHRCIKKKGRTPGVNSLYS